MNIRFFIAFTSILLSVWLGASFFRSIPNEGYSALSSGAQQILSAVSMQEEDTKSTLVSSNNK